MNNYCNDPDLKPEQQFAVLKFSKDVAHLSEKESKELLIQMYAQSLVKQNYYNALLKVEWGIG